MAYQLTDEDRRYALQEAMRQIAPKPQQTRQPQQKGNFFTDLIPTGGGIGGALGGAALGAAGGPIGSLIGAVIGGAAGSGIGKIGENVVEGQENVFEGVPQEIALGGVFSAPPIRLAKGLVTGGVGALKGGGGQAVKQSLESALTEPGMITNALKGAGAGLRAEGRGINVGTRLAGDRIGTQKAGQLNKFLDEVVGAKGGPVKQLKTVEDFIKQRSDQLTSAINQGNRALTKTDKNALIKRLQNEFNKVISPTERQSGIYNDIITRIQQTKDVAGLDSLRKAIDDNINFARNAASPEPAAEQIYKLFRTGITDDVANKIGAAKGLKGQLHKAFDAQELLLNKAGGKWDFGNAPNLAGVPIPKAASRAVTTIASGGLNAGGNIAGRLGSPLTSLGLRQGVGGMLTSGANSQPRSLEDALANYSPDNPDNTMAMPYSTTNATNTVANNSNMSTLYQNNSEMSTPYGRENLLYDIQRDPANADQYIAYYQQLQEIFAQPAQPEYSSAVAGRIADTEKGLQGLQDLSDLVNSPDFAGGAIQGTLRQFNPLDEQFQTQQAQIDAVRQFVGKALEGGVLRKEDEEKYRRILPTLQDQPDVARSKIAYLTQMIQRDLANYRSLVGGATSLEDALMMQGTGAGGF